MSARYDIEDDDYEDEEIERVYDDPNQCPECGDNLDEFGLCASCDY